jgi:hypothetical protein
MKRSRTEYGSDASCMRMVKQYAQKAGLAAPQDAAPQPRRRSSRRCICERLAARTREFDPKIFKKIFWDLSTRDYGVLGGWRGPTEAR